MADTPQKGRVAKKISSTHVVSMSEITLDSNGPQSSLLPIIVNASPLHCTSTFLEIMKL